MRKFSTAALLATAPLALVTSHAFANGTTGAADIHANAAATAQAMGIGTPPQADVQPFEQAKLSLVQAVTDAQKELRGTPVAARFELWQHHPSYLIRTYTSNELWQERVDANTGQALGQPTSVPEDQLGPQLKNDLAAAQNVQTNLAQAVSNAEQKQGGKVIMAALYARPDGTLDYKLDLVKDNALHVARVDAQTGQLR